MPLHVDLDDSQESFLKNNAKIVTMADGREFYYIPYWFEKPAGPNPMRGLGKTQMNVLSFDQLPPDFLAEVDRIRDSETKKFEQSLEDKSFQRTMSSFEAACNTIEYLTLEQVMEKYGHLLNESEKTRIKSVYDQQSKK